MTGDEVLGQHVDALSLTVGMGLNRYDLTDPRMHARRLSGGLTFEVLDEGALELVVTRYRATLLVPR